jgi:hypothetical protein
MAQMKYPGPSADFEPINIVSLDLSLHSRKIMPFSVSDILEMGAKPLYTTGESTSTNPDRFLGKSVVSAGTHVFIRIQTSTTLKFGDRPQ